MCHAHCWNNCLMFSTRNLHCRTPQCTADRSRNQPAMSGFILPSGWKSKDFSSQQRINYVTEYKSPFFVILTANTNTDITTLKWFHKSSSLATTTVCLLTIMSRDNIRSYDWSALACFQGSTSSTPALVLKIAEVHGILTSKIGQVTKWVKFSKQRTAER